MKHLKALVAKQRADFEKGLLPTYQQLKVLWDAVDNIPQQPLAQELDHTLGGANVDTVGVAQTPTAP